jgi:hypothetical protein
MRRRSSRRAGFNPARRIAFVAALALCLFWQMGPVAAADDTTPVVSATIYGSPGTPSTASVTVGDLQANATQCPVYNGPSLEQYGTGAPGGGVPPTSETWSIPTLLECMGIQPGAVTYVDVLNQDGQPYDRQSAELTHADLTTPNDWANRAEQPIIVYGGSSSEPSYYYRPARSADDNNFADSVGYPAPINIEVFEGQSLNVAISAVPQTVTAGGTVDLSARATGLTGTVTYHWDFGNGKTSTEPTPQATYTHAGTFPIGLQVSDSHGDEGIAQTVPVTVNSSSGPPPTTTGTTTTPGNGLPDGSTSPTGPQHGSHTPHTGNSGTPGGRQTPGSKTGSKKGGTQHGHSHRKSRHSASSTGGSGSGPSPTGQQASNLPSSPLPIATTPRPTTAHRAATGQRSPATLKSPAPPASTGAKLVTGRLVSALVALPLSTSPLVHPEAGGRTPQPAVRQGVTVSPLGALAAALVIVGLLGLGAGRELRGRRAWRRLTFGA